MKETYVSKDIVQMAVQAKARGEKLYHALAKNSENYHVAKLFEKMAKDEARHRAELEKWLEYLSGDRPEEAYPGERALYLKALVDQNTYTCGMTMKKALEKTINEEDALQAGITFEKDFMLFLHELKHHAAKDDQSTIDSLIEDEIGHIREFFALKDSLQKGE
ncbi:MAG: ferritin family protein [Candidatus Omnitrophota bacterium]